MNEKRMELPTECQALPPELRKALLALGERILHIKWMNGPKDERRCVALLEEYFGILNGDWELDGRSWRRGYARGEHLFKPDEEDYQRFADFGIKWIRQSWEEALGWTRHCYLRGNVYRLGHILDYMTEVGNRSGLGEARHVAWDFFGKTAADHAIDSVKDGVWFTVGAMAAWTVISDVVEKPNPFEPLLGLWEQGTWPIGHVHSYQDDFILFVPRVPPVKAFISYKWQDEERNKWVEEFYLDLRARGIDAKLDRYEVPPGGSFTQFMASKIAECERVLFVITPASVKAVNRGSGGVAFEAQLSNAIRMSESRGAFVIPILREGKVAPYFLRDHRWLDFRSADSYHNNLQELQDWLTGAIVPPPLGSPRKQKPGR